jgi:hypothetical protein
MVLLLGALLAGPLALAAQQKAATPKPGGETPAPLVFEREVFTYPTQGRRNPFRPLLGQAEAGPRFEQLRLEGIIYDDANPKNSVAALGTSTVTEAPDSTSTNVSKGEAWYLKAGQTIGNVRIVQIGQDQVVVDVEEFGLTTRKIMQIQTRRPGGGTS